jgi:hypothetical protein
MGLFDKLKDAAADVVNAAGEPHPSTTGQPEALPAGSELAAAASALGFAGDARLWRDGYRSSTTTLGSLAARAASGAGMGSSIALSLAATSVPEPVCGPTMWGMYEGFDVTVFEFTRGDLVDQLGVEFSLDKWTQVACAVVRLPYRVPSVALVPKRFGLRSKHRIDVGGVDEAFSVVTGRLDFARLFFNEAVVSTMSSVLDSLDSDTNWLYETVDRFLLIGRAGRLDWPSLRSVLSHAHMLVEGIDSEVSSRAWEPAVVAGPRLATYPSVYPPGHSYLIGVTAEAFTKAASVVDVGDGLIGALALAAAQLRTEVVATQGDADPDLARPPGWYEVTPGRICYFDGAVMVYESEMPIGDLWGLAPSPAGPDAAWPGFHFVDSTTKRWWDGSQWGEIEFRVDDRLRVHRLPDGFTPPAPARRA